jgi:NAD(P)-dependent dehydrogenase (short-subunit alcohol dehydrogenase family)
MSEEREPQPVHLIVGATGGIGSVLCRRLVRDGARVAAAARDGERLRALADELDVATWTLDATLPAAVEAAAREVAARFGRLDGIANCVGSIVFKPAHLTSDDDWNGIIACNLTSAFAAVRAAGRVIRGEGSVVLVSSAAARTGLPNHEAIAAAKAGVIGLARSAAATYASRGLRFNVVAPGLVRTGLSTAVTANPAAERASIAMHPLGRLGEPEEIASVMAWLLGPASGWVTGEVIGVDGGLAGLRGRPARASRPAVGR